MSECRRTSTPMDATGKTVEKDSPDNCTKLDDIPYQSAVGALLYLVQATRPDLAFVVSTLSRYNQSFDQTHWTMVKRVFRYLQGTMDYKLQYRRDRESTLRGYYDASHAPSTTDHRSITGYVFMMQGGAVSWNSKRQSTVALSSTEAEYLSLSSAVQEAIWLRSFCMSINLQGEEPIKVYCDNKGAIELGKNARFSARTKHINVRHQFVRIE